jgi:quinolinate synthase
MKKNSLKKIYKALKNMKTVIEIEEMTRLKAASALEKMLV